MYTPQHPLAAGHGSIFLLPNQGHIEACLITLRCFSECRTQLPFPQKLYNTTFDSKLIPKSRKKFTLFNNRSRSELPVGSNKSPAVLCSHWRKKGSFRVQSGTSASFVTHYELIRAQTNQEVRRLAFFLRHLQLLSLNQSKAVIEDNQMHPSPSTSEIFIISEKAEKEDLKKTNMGPPQQIELFGKERKEELQKIIGRKQCLKFNLSTSSG